MLCTPCCDCTDRSPARSAAPRGEGREVAVANATYPTLLARTGSTYSRRICQDCRCPNPTRHRSSFAGANLHPCQACGPTEVTCTSSPCRLFHIRSCPIRRARSKAPDRLMAALDLDRIGLCCASGRAACWRRGAASLTELASSASNNVLASCHPIGRAVLPGPLVSDERRC
jgi:hypothetical protein